MAHAVRTPTTDNDPGRGLDLRKLGMWTFLGSEVFFFGALIVTHLSQRGLVPPPNSRFVQPDPKELFGANVITSILAFILLLSSLTMVLALDAAKTNKQRGLKLWLGATIFLGLCFLSG
ncbi:MAG TPA: cytochrome oxidase subunit III, partial [Herpetosiphonaceae bacterium]